LLLHIGVTIIKELSKKTSIICGYPILKVIYDSFCRARRSTGHFSSAVSALLEEEDDQAMYQTDPSAQEEQLYGYEDSVQGVCHTFV
jgi:hypothetical protein